MARSGLYCAQCVDEREEPEVFECRWDGVAAVRNDLAKGKRPDGASTFRL